MASNKFSGNFSVFVGKNLEVPMELGLKILQRSGMKTQVSGVRTDTLAS
jgi:hypothetical protein